MEADSPYFGLTTDSAEALKRRTEEERQQKSDLALAQKKTADEEKRRQSMARLDQVREEVEALARIKRDLIRDRSFKHRREKGENSMSSILYKTFVLACITHVVDGLIAI